ncbi:MAG: preprotein translocase subunit SecG [Candidatus Omnitrophota bacterium]
MGFIVFFHIVVSILLVITILMQAGRGGGLAESFASAESMFGTQTNSFMVRFSTILATLFFCTALVLAINSSKGQKSLMANAKIPAKASQAAKAEEAPIKVSDPKPIEETTMPLTNSVK